MIIDRVEPDGSGATPVAATSVVAAPASRVARHGVATTDTQSADAEIASVIERVDSLIDEVRAADPRAAAAADALARELVGLYGLGLARLMGLITASGDTELAAHIDADPLLSSLLRVHDLRPVAGSPVDRVGDPPAPPVGPVAPPPGRATLPLVGIGRRRAEPAAVAPPGPSCELCSVAVADEHRHLVDLDSRRIRCACTACSLLFESRGGDEAGRAGTRYRAIPARVHTDPANPLRPADIDRLGVPVSVAFFFHSTAVGGPAACFPSPAGATESEVDPQVWAALCTRHPLLGAIAPDVEAILTHRTPEGVEALLVPIDVCYGLVGEVRRHWTGLEGGPVAHERVVRLFDRLRDRATVMPTAPTRGAP